jgi:hypothetical protein
VHPPRRPAGDAEADADFVSEEGCRLPVPANTPHAARVWAVSARHMAMLGAAQYNDGVLRRLAWGRCCCFCCLASTRRSL